MKAYPTRIFNRGVQASVTINHDPEPVISGEDTNMVVEIFKFKHLEHVVEFFCCPPT